MNGAKLDHDDQLLDALLAAAVERLQNSEPNLENLARLAANLTEEDRKELARAGNDAIARITAAKPVTEYLAFQAAPEVVEEMELAGAMNRGDTDELTDAARQEIERKVQDATNSKDNDGNRTRN